MHVKCSCIEFLYDTNIHLPPPQKKTHIYVSVKNIHKCLFNFIDFSIKNFFHFLVPILQQQQKKNPLQMIINVVELCREWYKELCCYTYSFKKVKKRIILPLSFLFFSLSPRQYHWFSWKLIETDICVWSVPISLNKWIFILLDIV